MAGTDGSRERWNAVHEPHPARHSLAKKQLSFAGSFAALGNLAYEGAEVSAHVIDLRSGEVIFAIDERIVLPTAGIGTLLLLIETSARLAATDTSVLSPLTRIPALAVGDAGLWRHLHTTALPVADLAALVAATGDNLATNVLLHRIGMDAVRQRADGLGLVKTALLDQARNKRGPDDAPYLSVGSTFELTALMVALTRGRVVDPVTSERVLGWLALNADLSLVASAFGLDPLSHGRVEHGIHLVNKTGSSPGVRAEVGALRGPRSSIAYAVSIRFDDSNLPSRLRVLDALRSVGNDILEHVH